MAVNHKVVGSNPTLGANRGLLAQQAEQRAFNPKVQGSIPWGSTTVAHSVVASLKVTLSVRGTNPKLSQET